MPHTVHEFGGFRFDPARLRLSREGRRIHVSRRALEVLAILLRRPGSVVPREELFAEVWRGAFVEDASLTQAIFVLRKTLGDDSTDPRFIATVAGRGYAFVGPVDEVIEEAESTAAAEATTASSSAAERRPRAAAWRRPATAAVGLVLALGLLLAYGTIRRSPSPRVESLAVVRFANLGSEAHSYLGEGLAEALITELSRSFEVRIPPLGAAQDLPADPSSRAARELGLDAILTGTFLKSGDTLRVTSRLLRVGDGRTLWAGQRDVRAGDALALQDQVSAWLSESLGERLPAFEQPAPTVRAERSTCRSSRDAYEELLKGRFLLAAVNEPALRRSLEHFAEAERLDPRCAVAVAGTARAQMLLGGYGYGDRAPRDHFAAARAAANRALRLDANCAEAWVILAALALLDEYRPEEALSRVERALRADPDNVQAHHYRAWILFLLGDGRRADREFEQALQLDPLSLIARTARGTLALYRGDLEAARGHYRQVLELDPGFARAHYGLGLVLEQQGDLTGAERHLRTAIERFGDPREGLAALAHLQGRAGRTADWESTYRALGGDEAPPQFRAVAQLGVGERSRALAAFTTAVRERRVRPFELLGDPRLEPLRTAPEFRESLRTMGIRADRRPRP